VRSTTTAATDELASAIELSEAIAAPLVEDRVAPVTAGRRAAQSAHIRPRAKPGSVLAARAANEYVYVAQDIRRIVVVAGLLFGAMIGAWLLLVVLKVVPLGIY
jgi:hypothetical protein